MKKFVVMLVICVIAFSICAFGANDVKVLLDDGYMNFTDENGNIVNPEITNDRTMVPLRKIFEALKAKVDWDNATRTITATKNSRTVKLTIDSKTAYVIENGKTESISLDSAPYIVDGRTLIPLRFVSESFNCLVGWDSATRTAIIINPESLVEYAMPQILIQCTNLEKFATSLKTSDYYSVTKVDINVPGLQQSTGVFSDNISFNVINNKNKIYANFLENFIVTDSTEDYDVKNAFFELDLSEVIENGNYGTTIENTAYKYFKNMQSEEITLDTYNEMKLLIDDLVKIASNDHFKFDGKTVNWSFKLNDMEYIKNESSSEDIKFDINIALESGLIKTSNTKIKTPDGIVLIDTNTTYSSSAYQLPSSADVSPLEELITTLVFIMVMSSMSY